jgi:hypothetical protein
VILLNDEDNGIIRHQQEAGECLDDPKIDFASGKRFFPSEKGFSVEGGGSVSLNIAGYCKGLPDHRKRSAFGWHISEHSGIAFLCITDTVDAAPADAVPVMQNLISVLSQITKYGGYNAFKLPIVIKEKSGSFKCIQMNGRFIESCFQITADTESEALGTVLKKFPEWNQIYKKEGESK